jgi:hypothetical protein
MAKKVVNTETMLSQYDQKLRDSACFSPEDGGSGVSFQIPCEYCTPS